MMKFGTIKQVVEKRVSKGSAMPTSQGDRPQQLQIFGTPPHLCQNGLTWSKGVNRSLVIRWLVIKLIVDFSTCGNQCRGLCCGGTVVILGHVTRQMAAVSWEWHRMGTPHAPVADQCTALSFPFLPHPLPFTWTLYMHYRHKDTHTHIFISLSVLPCKTIIG